MTQQDVLRNLARLMQQTAVKQAVQERALHRLLALLPPSRPPRRRQGCERTCSR